MSLYQGLEIDSFPSGHATVAVVVHGFLACWGMLRASCRCAVEGWDGYWRAAAGDCVFAALTFMMSTLHPAS